MKDLIILAIGLSLITAGTSLMMYAIGQSTIYNYEKQECQKWSLEAISYKDVGYFLADWQKDQCDHYGITIK